jgi:predicted metalloenzyme YecM
MITSINQFYNGAKEAIAQLNRFIFNNSLQELVKADHICYKCDSSSVFERMRLLFETQSWMYQSIIAKRRIALIKLPSPFETTAGNINLLELSDQKQDNSQTNRYDHIEIYSTKLKYDELVSLISSKGLRVNEIVRPHHTTHDITLDTGFIIRLTREPLLEKIKDEIK